MNKNNPNILKQVKVRFAQEEDLNSILDIYNQAIQAGNATADTEAIDLDNRYNWFNSHSSTDFPIYVLEHKNEILGYGSLSAYRRGRKALASTAEISYYLDYSEIGKGYGKFLFEHILRDTKRLKIKHLLAFLLEVNDVSIGLLEHYGFEKWGLLPNIVHLRDQTCGHLIYGKKMNN